MLEIQLSWKQAQCFMSLASKTNTFPTTRAIQYRNDTRWQNRRSLGIDPFMFGEAQEQQLAQKVGTEKKP